MNGIVHQGDCLDVMRGLPDASVDAVVTDPPYALNAGSGTHGFLGHTWDTGQIAFDPETWRAVLRVATPGANLLAFGGTRTWHRLACAIEDAGWDIKDTLMWLYGQGFPKHRSLLKPAWEPILLARKRGGGQLNIDACRIPSLTSTTRTTRAPGGYRGGNKAPADTGSEHGRWPANVVLTHTEQCRLLGTRRVKGTAPIGPNGGNTPHSYSGGFPGRVYPPPCYADDDGMETVEAWDCADGCPVALLDQQSGIRPTSLRRPGLPPTNRGGYTGPMPRYASDVSYGDTGTASRFFYVAKASSRERTAGLTRTEGARNTHPTVKPVALMQYLVRLVTPTGGTVLDPFAGSGSTGVAALAGGYAFIGIEQDAAYCAIARQRLDAARATKAAAND